MSPQAPAAQPAKDKTQRQAADAAGLPGTGLPARTAPANPGPSAESDPIRGLEEQVQVVLTEARRQQAQLVELHQQLSAAQSANAWLPWLVLGLVAAGAAVAWLALRVRRLQRELADRDWAKAADARHVAGAGDASNGVPLPLPDAPLSSSRASIVPGAAVTAPDMTIAQPRIAAPRMESSPSAGLKDPLARTGVPPRPVTVEELLDLDQQVEFFLVLGQVSSAIDLLLGHVRSTGGTNALPYFKLLEIYRQQGDEEAYERTRERFNQRFNAFVPDMSADLMSGRSLEDYPEVVERLQRAWPQPLRAVAELESLLLRRADLEPFDLPAYRDVLMLHALVRDLPAGALHAATTTVPKALLTSAALHDTAPTAAAGPVVDESSRASLPAKPGNVDVLLPLGERASEVTVPHSLVTERAAAQAMLAEWVFTRSTQPRTSEPSDNAALPPVAPDLLDLPMDLDLDLSQAAAPPREFTHGATLNDIELRRDSRFSDFGALDGAGRPPPASQR